MQIDVGCFYFIKDTFFDVIDDKVLGLYKHGMKNIIFPDIEKILKQLLK